MKQSLLLPGITLPAGQAEEHAKTQWPSVAELLNAVAECDLPSCGLPEENACEDTTEISPITVLGLGLNNPEVEFSSIISTIVKESDVLAAGSELLARFSSCEAEMLPLRAPLRQALDTLLERRRAGKRVTVLANGDPLFFGIGATLAKLLPPEALRVLPGVGSLQEACARARLPWHDVLSISLHGRNGFAELAVAALAGKPLCLLTDAVNTPAAAARFLLDRGVDWHEMLVFENLRARNENSRVCTLAEAANLDFGPACTVLLIPNAPPRHARLGLPDPQPAGAGGMFTKGAVRAAALAALGIAPQHLVWDLGAGSGLVALEASALANRGRVFAVERDPARIVFIEENRRRCGAANLEIIHGKAPDCLDDLPDPDAVFLGGGLGRAEEAAPLLTAICSRLKRDGRLVISCILLSSLERARALLGELGMPCEIACIQVSESAPLAGDLRLAALNPVFLLSSTKENL